MVEEKAFKEANLVEENVYKLMVGEDSIEYDVEQGTSEWHELRLGKVTASVAAPLLVKGTKGSSFGKGALTYLKKLVAEKVTGLHDELTGIAALEHGKRNEPYARKLYELTRDVTVEESGFIAASEYCGISLDGIIVEDGEAVGIVEIKCPMNFDKLVEYQSDGLTDKQYIVQVQLQLLVSGLPYCDFVVYDSRYPQGKQLYIERVYPDEAMQQQLKERIEEFSVLIDEGVKAFMEMPDCAEITEEALDIDIRHSLIANQH